MRQFTIGASLIAWLLFSIPVSAVPVTYDFTGTITSLTTNLNPDRVLGLLPGTLAGGTDLFFRPLSGSLTLDANAAVDTNPDPNIGSYSGFDLISAFSISFEGFDFALDPTRLDNTASALVKISRPENINDERFDINASLGTGVLPGAAAGLETRLTFTFLAFLFEDFFNINIDFAAIETDRFPTDLTVFTKPAVSLGFFDSVSGEMVSYNSRFDSVTRRDTLLQSATDLQSATVPEVGTPLLFGLGMLALLYGTSRRRARIRGVLG